MFETIVPLVVFWLTTGLIGYKKSCRKDMLGQPSNIEDRTFMMFFSCLGGPISLLITGAIIPLFKRKSIMYQVPLVLANQATKNGNIYTAEALKNAAIRLKGRKVFGNCKYKCKLGTMIHPELSHSIDDIEFKIKDNALVGDVSIRKGKGGEKLRELLRAGEIEFCMAGNGTVNHTPNGKIVTDYNLKSVNAVAAKSDE